jgi:hypothetical protein
MIGQSLAHMDIAALQKAVLGMDPAIKPYAALAALQEKVKSQQMKQGQALQNPAQPPVAQQMMAQAQQLSPAQISNPYMASGLGAAPVQSPVQEPATGMASGGIVAFDEGGEVPRFAGPTGSQVQEAQTFVDAMGIERNSKTGEPVKSMLSRIGDFRDREQAKAAMPERRIANATDELMLRPTAAPASADSRPYIERDLTTRPPGLASLVGKITPAANLKKEGSTKRGPANVAATPTEKPKAGLGQTDQASRYDTTPQYKTMDESLAARKNAEKNTDVLPEDEYSKTLRQNLTKREERLAQAEKKGEQMAYLQAAGAFFGPGSLQQNASRAIPMFAEAKMKANSALEAAQEKATDAQDAWARYNQARQDGNKKDAREAFKDFNAYTTQAKQLQLTGQHYQDTAAHYIRADATGSRMADASMVAAQNRGLGGGGGGEKRQLDQLKALQTSLKDQLKDPMLSLPRNAAQKAALAKQLVEVNGAIAGMAGLNTMPETTLSPGAGGVNRLPLDQYYIK